MSLTSNPTATGASGIYNICANYMMKLVDASVFSRGDSVAARVAEQKPVPRKEMMARGVFQPDFEWLSPEENDEHALYLYVSGKLGDIKHGSAAAQRKAMTSLERVPLAHLANLAEDKRNVRGTGPVLKLIDARFKNPADIVKKFFPDLVDPLIVAAGLSEQEGTIAALEILAKRSPRSPEGKNALEELRRTAFSSDSLFPAWRATAIQSLGRLGDHASQDKILAILTGASVHQNDHFIAAAKVLADWDAKEAIPYLRTALERGDLDGISKNCAMAEALFRLGDRKYALNYLRTSVVDPKNDLNRAMIVVESVKNISDEFHFVRSDFFGANLNLVSRFCDAIIEDMDNPRREDWAGCLTSSMSQFNAWELRKIATTNYGNVIVDKLKVIANQHASKSVRTAAEESLKRLRQY